MADELNLLSFSRYVNKSRKTHVKFQVCVFKERSEPFIEYDYDEFRRFRLSKTTVTKIIEQDC